MACISFRNINAQKLPQFSPLTRIFKRSDMQRTWRVSAEKVLHFNVMEPVNVFIMLRMTYKFHKFFRVALIFGLFINLFRIKHFKVF